MERASRGSRRSRAGSRLSGDASGADRLLGSVEWTEVELRERTARPAAARGRRRNRHVPVLLRGLRARGLGVDHAAAGRPASSATRTSTSRRACAWRRASRRPFDRRRAWPAAFLASVQSGTAFPMGFATFTPTASTRLEAGLENAVVAADARGYVLKGPWAFVGHIGTLVGWRLDPEYQIPLDGDAGVRGYRLHAVEGDRRLVGNAEARVLVVPEIFSLALVRLRGVRRRRLLVGRAGRLLASRGRRRRPAHRDHAREQEFSSSGSTSHACSTRIRSGGPGGSCRSRRDRRSEAYRRQWIPQLASQRSASIAALQPSPAAEIACR